MKKEPGQGVWFWGEFCVAVAAVLAGFLVLSGFGTRWGWWGFRTGLSILRWAAYGEIAMVVLSLACCLLPSVRKSGQALTLFVVASVISIAAAGLPLSKWMTFRSVPMIHDITTDTENPPQFETLLKLRTGALNPAAYGGQKIAEEQHKAYPDIVPLILELPPSRAFERSLSTAKKLGWKIVSADPEQGRIEATDSTFWFGFTDDIVIRITAQDNGSHVDIRSLSRVGKSDIGTNARRIRKFLHSINQK